ncbi:hypothetical protein BD408DRAFT_407605 [Parasitella parasitica]|nr:hypothetical protein BD408DRAFT_407605 [Parasitella parasitica]
MHYCFDVVPTCGYFEVVEKYSLGNVTMSLTRPNGTVVENYSPTQGYGHFVKFDQIKFNMSARMEYALYKFVSFLNRSREYSVDQWTNLCVSRGWQFEYARVKHKLSKFVGSEEYQDMSKSNLRYSYATNRDDPMTVLLRRVPASERILWYIFNLIRNRTDLNWCTSCAMFGDLSWSSRPACFQCGRSIPEFESYRENSLDSILPHYSDLEYLFEVHDLPDLMEEFTSNLVSDPVSSSMLKTIVDGEECLQDLNRRLGDERFICPDAVDLPETTVNEYSASFCRFKDGELKLDAVSDITSPDVSFTHLVFLPHAEGANSHWYVNVRMLLLVSKPGLSLAELLRLNPPNSEYRSVSPRKLDVVESSVCPSSDSFISSSLALSDVHSSPVDSPLLVCGLKRKLSLFAGLTKSMVYLFIEDGVLVASTSRPALSRPLGGITHVVSRFGNTGSRYDISGEDLQSLVSHNKVFAVKYKLAPVHFFLSDTGRKAVSLLVSNTSGQDSVPAVAPVVAVPVSVGIGAPTGSSVCPETFNSNHASNMQNAVDMAFPGVSVQDYLHDQSKIHYSDLDLPVDTCPDLEAPQNVALVFNKCMLRFSELFGKHDILEFAEYNRRNPLI